MRSTPKTLIDAAKNGLDDIAATGQTGSTDEIIHRHVKDFLAQRFTVAMIENPSNANLLKELFNQLTK